MARGRANDSRDFRNFRDAKPSKGGPDLPHDEALSLWEYQNATEDEREETLQAIRSGLEDMQAGRTRPAEEALRELCRKQGVPVPR